MDLCRNVSVIHSKAGAVRSNHWHKTDEHYLYIVTGRMEYFSRPVGSKEAPWMAIVGPYEMVYTPANAEHTTYFPVETLMISISKYARDHETHEADLVRCGDVRV